jgi:biotin carboxyl carrier protein
MEENLEYLNINSGLYKTRISPRFRNRKPYKPADPKLVMSFIPGTVIDILVKEGQSVKKGDELMILEAMKMKNRIKSSLDGKIRKILVAKGSKVPKGVILIEMV